MSSEGIAQASPAFAGGSGRSAAARLLGRPVLWLPLLWLAALLFYLPNYLHSDVSWYLVATERFVNGARLYQDVIEVNPPLAFYLMAPPVLAADVIGVSSRMAFVCYVFILLALSLWLVDRLLRQMSGVADSARGAFLLAMFGAVVILALPVFGQREHLMLILSIPYILLLGHRLAGRSCSLLLAVGVGAAAAVGIGLKPYFVIVPALLELYVMALRRSPFAVLRAETMTLLAGLTAYIALAAVLNPEYFTFMLPYALLVYDAYSSSLIDVLTQPAVFILLLPACAYVLARSAGAADRQSDALAIASAGFFVGYVLQSKGWDYQLLPAGVTIFLAMAWILTTLLARATPANQARRPQLIAWTTAALALLALAPMIRGPFTNPFTDKLLPIVEKYASGGAIYGFTSHVWVGFPLVNEAGVGWSSRFPTQWLLPGAREQLAGAANLDPDRKRKLQEIEQYVTDAVAVDFGRLPPDLVIVDTDNPYMREANFDYIAYFQRDPRFARLWQSYVKIGQVSLAVGASPLSGGTKRVFDLWCRKSATHECPSLPADG
ncbi:MAG TPA: hypothetical protein VE914_21655 [Candidatus Angelobacter sp.]|nr:hypothetical protein [Candidatus Angelobacter sp.]